MLYYCQPIVKKVRGWRETPIFARSRWWRAQRHPITLPESVCELLGIIEYFTGTTVISIGNGPKGDEIIYIRRAAASAGRRESFSPGSLGKSFSRRSGR